MKPRPPGSGTGEPSAGSSDPRVGDTVLGSFHLQRRLAGGAFAVAYLARQLGTERYAVVKIPHLHLMDESEDAAHIRSRFAAELRASTRVSHPNIAVVYTAGDTADGVPAIAMEYVPGPMLARQLATAAPLSPAEAGRLGCQIASALGAVHAAGIIHRDVTPRNIIASSDAEGCSRHVLLDFGIAKLDGLANRTLGMVGTPRYMAPEQMRGRAVPQSDMFGLGAVLWWALTAREYLAETAGLAGVVLRQLQQREPPDPRELRPSLPAPVAELVSRLLHPDAEQRPDARTFAETWMRLTRDWSESQPAAAVHASPDAGAARILDAGTGEAARGSTPVLPETLDSTGESLDGYPLRAQQQPMTLERFLGVMPEWLTDLQEAVLGQDSAAIVEVCDRIAGSARLMGADRLARHSDILAGLAEDEILDQASGFLREIQAEFQRWFRELLQSRQSSL
jgi:serine/threonine protein kinase